MRIVIFCHSLISDWNHGNAHFLRGIASELLGLGHDLQVFEPQDAWSMRGLVEDCGPDAPEGFRRVYPKLRSTRYSLDSLELEPLLANADLVIVHEWSDPELVRRVGVHHAACPGYVLLFHDSHHRSVSAPGEMARYELQSYDAVLAFGEVVRTHYVRNHWCRRAFVWHEAADTQKFFPQAPQQRVADLVWIGNFGDDERSAELEEFLIDPVKRLGISATVYGVRYPAAVREKLESSGIRYGGYLPNWEVPRVFSQHQLTIHVPRRPYAQQLPGIPTIRPFEAMACGIPLISAPWKDCERLFNESVDYWIVHDGVEMRRAIPRLLAQPQLAREMTERARGTILSRHTCAHRVAELMAIYRAIRNENGHSPMVQVESERCSAA